MAVRKSLAVLAAAFGLNLAVTGAVFADPVPETQAAFDRGMSAYQAGDTQGAVTEWTEAVDGGHVGAAWLLGNLYDKGIGGVAQSDAKAYEYYLRASRGGQPEAAMRLGLIYLEGNEKIGLKRNYDEALRSFEMAALAPRADAQYYLRWLFLAAKKRYGPAFAELGRIHMEGEGVQANRVEGWSYLLLANRFGDKAQRADADLLMEKYSGWMKGSETGEAREMADAWIASHGGA